MPAACIDYQFQEPACIRLTDDERDSGVISDETVAFAVSAMHRDGLVVLENAVDVDHIDEINRILSVEADAMAKLPTTHFNDVRSPIYSIAAQS